MSRNFYYFYKTMHSQYIIIFSEENGRLLNKVQQLELRVNNVSPVESLSSQTHVADWDYVRKTELPVNKIYMILITNNMCVELLVNINEIKNTQQTQNN